MADKTSNILDTLVGLIYGVILTSLKGWVFTLATGLMILMVWRFLEWVHDG